MRTTIKPLPGETLPGTLSRVQRQISRDHVAIPYYDTNEIVVINDPTSSTAYDWHAYRIGDHRLFRYDAFNAVRTSAARYSRSHSGVRFRVSRHESRMVIAERVRTSYLSATGPADLEVGEQWFEPSGKNPDIRRWQKYCAPILGEFHVEIDWNRNVVVLTRTS